MKVGIIGGGRVGSRLAACLHEAGVLAGITAASERHSAQLAQQFGVPVTDNVELWQATDVLLLTVPDRLIGTVAEELAQSVTPAAKVVLHVSGSVGLEPLAPLTQLGANVGSLHPLQSFADLITIEEYKKTARPKVVMTWAPHPRPLPQAVPNSFAEWMNATDYEFVITHPEGYELDPKFVGNARVEYDQMKAFEGADFIYAKNWAAYTGDNYGQILSTDRNWTVGDRQMAVTNNAYFMHCLPVRRNMIVTDDVIESPQSIVIPEAANREISATVVLKRLLENLP